MPVTAAPERTQQQRTAALIKANRIRLKRAQLKRDLKHKRVSPLDLLHEPPEWIETMKLNDLLLAVPKYGRVKVTRLLRDHRISPSITVGGLSSRQRAEIFSAMRC